MPAVVAGEGQRRIGGERDGRAPDAAGDREQQARIVEPRVVDGAAEREIVRGHRCILTAPAPASTRVRGAAMRRSGDERGRGRWTTRACTMRAVPRTPPCRAKPR